MQDINLVRENPEVIKKDLEKRKDTERIKLVDEVKSLDEKWRKLKYEEDQLRSKRNKLSKQVSQYKKEGKDAAKILEEVKKIPNEIKKSEGERKELEQKITEGLYNLPNITVDSVPYGKDDSENVEIKNHGEKKKKNFELKPHQEIAENLGVADFERSTKLSGSGFYILKGDLALLNQALIRFAIDHMINKGFEYTEVPYMMNKDAYQTGVSMEDFEDVMYKIDGEDKYLIATSEHPLLGQFIGEKIEEEELPIKLTSYSMCFRKEVGSHGIDTKGLFRTHQFNKVEMAVLSKPEDSWEIHEELQKNAEEVMQKLELPYRVVNICTGDLGDLAAKKYDIEAWMPRGEEYREVGSNSNFTDYHARRANIKYHKKKTNEFPYVHTLNNTVIATSRIMVAILENYQNEDGSVTVPEVLRPYMFGKEIMK